MANNKRRNEIQQVYQRKAKEQQYEAVTKRIFKFPCIALAISVLVLLLLFVSFADVYNSAAGAGVEVKVSGWSFVIAAITRDYNSTAKVYGNLAVPFYYYAGEWCESVATFTLIAAIAIIFTVVVQIIAVAVKKAHVLNGISAILGVVSAVMLIVSFAKGLGMKNGEILTTYCNNNPLCSIRSFAIFPALFCLAGSVVSTIAAVKYKNAAKLLK